MNQKTLEIIGRRHTVEDTVRAFELARECGFDNINMDLIVGLPGEHKEDMEHTLEEVKKLDPDSLTVHSLAVKRAARLNIFRDQYQEMTFENNQEIMDMAMKYAYEMGMGALLSLPAEKYVRKSGKYWALQKLTKREFTIY